MTIYLQGFMSAWLLQRKILKIFVSIFENSHLSPEFSGSILTCITISLKFIKLVSRKDLTWFLLFNKHTSPHHHDTMHDVDVLTFLLIYSQSIRKPYYYQDPLLCIIFSRFSHDNMIFWNFLSAHRTFFLPVIQFSFFSVFTIIEFWLKIAAILAPGKQIKIFHKRN